MIEELNRIIKDDCLNVMKAAVFRRFLFFDNF